MHKPPTTSADARFSCSDSKHKLEFAHTAHGGHVIGLGMDLQQEVGIFRSKCTCLRDTYHEWRGLLANEGGVKA